MNLSFILTVAVRGAGDDNLVTNLQHDMVTVIPVVQHDMVTVIPVAPPAAISPPSLGIES